MARRVVAALTRRAKRDAWSLSIGRECLRLLREAGEWLTDVRGAGLVTAHRAVIEADLPQRLDLVKAGTTGRKPNSLAPVVAFGRGRRTARSRRPRSWNW